MDLGGGLFSEFERVPSRRVPQGVGQGLFPPKQVTLPTSASREEALWAGLAA
jgi:hypothetical protein